MEDQDSNRTSTIQLTRHGTEPLTTEDASSNINMKENYTPFTAKKRPYSVAPPRAKSQLIPGSAGDNVTSVIGTGGVDHSPHGFNGSPPTSLMTPNLPHSRGTSAHDHAVLSSRSGTLNNSFTHSPRKNSFGPSAMESRRNSYQMDSRKSTMVASRRSSVMGQAAGVMKSPDGRRGSFPAGDDQYGGGKGVNTSMSNNS